MSLDLLEPSEAGFKWQVGGQPHVSADLGGGGGGGELAADEKEPLGDELREVNSSAVAWPKSPTSQHRPRKRFETIQQQVGLSRPCEEEPSAGRRRRSQLKRIEPQRQSQLESGSPLPSAPHSPGLSTFEVVDMGPALPPSACPARL